MGNLLDKNISTHMLLKFAFPTIVSMMFMGIYTTVDGIFVSRIIGTNALSAVNIVMPIITTAIALGAMLSTGGSAIVAKKMGEGEIEEARKIFSLLIVTAFVVSLFFSIVGMFFITPIIRFLGANDMIFTYSYEYAQMTLVFITFSTFSMIFQVFFITAGRASLGLKLSVLGGVCNIILDYVLIVVMDTGIRGAAIATGVGYSLPALVGFSYFLLNRKGTLFLVKPKFDKKIILKSCTNGASEMVTNLSIGVVIILLNNILIRLAGADGVAAITIIFYVQGLLASVYMGYSMGIAPIISYNYGKKDTNRLKKIYVISLKFITVLSLITFVVSQIFANSLVSIFAPAETSVYIMAVRGYRLFSICFLFMGFNVYGSTMFTALSNGRVSATLSFLRTLVFVVAAILLLPLIMGIDGVWISVPLAELLGFFVTVYYLKKFRIVYQY